MVPVAGSVPPLRLTLSNLHRLRGLPVAVTTGRQAGDWARHHGAIAGRSPRLGQIRALTQTPSLRGSSSAGSSHQLESLEGLQPGSGACKPALWLRFWLPISGRIQSAQASTLRAEAPPLQTCHHRSRTWPGWALRRPAAVTVSSAIHWGHRRQSKPAVPGCSASAGVKPARKGAGGGEAPRWVGASSGSEPGTGSASLESEGADPSERRRPEGGGDQGWGGDRGGTRDEQRFNVETPRRREGAEPERAGPELPGRSARN
uniref:Uncharacterized protein n=1 Tax=Rangifer tarandus platyrhynchus TaxID=3082113 RepID=A0ACB0ECT9_RANTA|nr:unnamed protein product [Rangifer tarandus platyrhynchus]